MPRNNFFDEDDLIGEKRDRTPLDKVFIQGRRHGDLGIMELHEASRGINTGRIIGRSDLDFAEADGFHIIDDDDVPEEDFGD